jgi:RNA polymerase sigma-70 factor (ECF subfamily)
MRLLRRRHPLQPLPSDDPDAQLVAWAQADPHAFVALYDRYFPAVYGYCLSQLEAPEAAEDAASDTFVKALAALPGYRESGRFRPWLFVIAHNAVQDTVRARRSHGTLEAAAGVSDPDAGPEERAIATVDRYWLEAVIARLPADEQRVLELRRAGLRGGEIAQVLGISHEAAKKRQLRAIARIRTALAAEGEVRRGA